MHRTTARVVAFAFACLSVASTAGASGPADERVPRLVKFTGIVAGAQGTTVALTFAFYPDQASETPLWTETQRVTIDEAGRYAVSLGAGRPEGLPLDLFASGEARWLGVREEGRAEQPRVLLVSVPYALKAADADTIGGRPLSAFVLTGDKTGVGADGLTYVDARVLTTGLTTGPPSAPGGSGAAGGLAPGGGGTANYIGLFTDPTTLGNSVLYQTPVGNIGVNTTTPMAAFHAVSGASPVAYYDVYSNALGSLPVVYRAARGTPSAPTAVQTDDILGGLAVRGYGSTGFSTGRGQVMFKAAQNWTDEANGTYLQFTTTPYGSVAWAERMRITPMGNVGIGTANPQQRLSVIGVVQSTTGGFMFPDGSVQATAAVRGFEDLDSMSLAAGSDALTWQTSGVYSAAFGHFSLRHNTTGDFNAAFGNQSLMANQVGSQLSAFGNVALSSNTTGSYNSAVGSFALRLNTTGSYNVAVGAETLYSVETGQYNTAVGHRALHAVTGDGNSAVGYRSLVSATGANNTGLGRETLGALTGGSDNVAIGGWAGERVLGGSGNVFIGSHAGVDAAHTSLDNAIAIGAGAIVSQSDSMVLGGTGANAVKVGIGTAAPLDELHVVGNARFSGCVRVGGVVVAGTCSSDARLKRDVRPFGAVLDRVAKLEPVHFTWRVDEFPARHFDRAENTGLIAQDVERLFPDLVSTDDRGFRQVNYGELPYLTLAAVKELKAENDALRVRVEAGDGTRDDQIRKLTEQVEALTRAVEALRARQQ